MNMNDKVLDYIIKAQSALILDNKKDTKMFLEEARNVLEQ